ncbi:MAG: restriction endonuclease subunit S [Nitrospiraceae bacterium]
MTPLGDVLTPYQEYIEAPEPKEYPKLSVKLYGKGVVLDAPADGTTLKMKRHQIAKTGQVILSEIWGKKGAIGFVPPEGDGALCTSHFFLFDVHREKLEPKYLQSIFTANYLQDQLDIEAKGTTGYAAVRPKNLLAAEIPLPPLPEQRRIVARIESLADKIEEALGGRKRVTVETEALITSTRRKTFSNNQYSVIRLAEACESIIDNLHSNPVYTDEGVPCIRSPDVGGGKLDLLNARKTSEQEYSRRTVRGEPSVGDIVLVREGGGTGKAALVRQGERFSLGQRVMMLRPKKDSVLPEFFLHQLLSPTIQDDQIVPLSKGSASPHLNIGALKKFSFQVPSLPDQHRIVAYLDGLQAKLDELKKLQSETADELAALLPSILDKAFKGDL